MKEITYNIHQALKIRIRGLSPWTLEAFNCLYSFFKAGNLGEDGNGETDKNQPDISVEMGSFKPDLAGCANVDHKFFIRRNYLYFRASDKGLHWEAEIRGLDMAGIGPIQVRFFAPASNRLKFPWCFFPDLILTLYVLNPLMELMLWKKGYFLLHSAGVAKEGQACLVAGRGGAHKTTFTMGLLRQGWKLLGDDMVLLHGGKVLAFPSVVQELDYLIRARKTEDLGLLGQFGLFRHLAANGPLALQVSEAAIPTTVNLVRVKDVKVASVHAGWDLDAMVASLVANHLMERICYVDFKFSTTSFLDAYEYVFPNVGFRHYPLELAASLKEHFSLSKCRILDIPFHWDPHHLDLLL